MNEQKSFLIFVTWIKEQEGEVWNWYKRKKIGSVWKKIDNDPRSMWMNEASWMGSMGGCRSFLKR